MRRLLIFILPFTLFCCREAVNEEDLMLLNGYWEIEKVVFPDGASREYSLNTTIDFIEFDNMKGYKKKVQPNLDGSFATSDDAEFFKVSVEKGIFSVRYQNNFSQWEEEIREIGKDHLVLRTAEGVSYHYKRYQTPVH